MIGKGALAASLGLILIWTSAFDEPAALARGPVPESRTDLAKDLRVRRAAAQPDLRSLLAGAAEYCDRLSRAVLDFVCRERVSEWSYPDAALTTRRMMDFIRRGPKESKACLYDFQLVRDRAGSIRESRTLLRDGRKDLHIEAASLQTRFFWHARIVMGPLGLLSRERQAEHDYRILREERIDGKPAAVVEAVPKPGVAADHLFGIVWLRLEDASILKIEWNPASIDNYAGVRETAERFRMEPRIVLTSEYGVEKNGIRFPSRYVVQEAYGRGSRRFERSETAVVYDRYKFFTVETEVIY
jgi:hypothetical protein